MSDPDPKITRIMDIVASAYDFSPRDLCSMRRQARLVLARHTAMWLCRQTTEESYPTIARCFGDRDHTTAMYAVSRINQLMAEKPAFASRVVILLEAIGEHADA